MMTICFATNNVHKLEEVRSALGPDFCLLSLHEIGCLQELPETGTTLEANALQKAQFVFHHYNIPCFADDTGLETLALAGAPGVDSAHYAGPQRSATDNIALLLKNLEGKNNRKARFKTILVWVEPTQQILFEGIVPGEILEKPRGNMGFGYDPVFLPEGYSKTFAEMDMAEKNSISHRARALEKLLEFLKSR
ncbi:MAG: RdgB/HAM1 family non-canonical purine NTP pyrophosphatase [Chryseotalea sp.]|jgi:XTP/dITP diphosphohydrolase